MVFEVIAMMGYVMGILILLALTFSVLLGTVDALSKAALSSGIEAVKLCFELCGTLALWSGIMRVAEKSGLCDVVNRVLSPVTNLLFRDLKRLSPRALSSISLNITANILGLGAAATPMALDAMAELDRLNRFSPVASDYMVIFVALNTASFQILPTTVATIRSAAGSNTPLDILPSVLIASACSVTVAVFLAMQLRRLRAFRKDAES